MLLTSTLSTQHVWVFRTPRSDVMELAHRDGLEAEILIGTQFRRRVFPCQARQSSPRAIFFSTETGRTFDASDRRADDDNKPDAWCSAGNRTDHPHQPCHSLFVGVMLFRLSANLEFLTRFVDLCTFLPPHHQQQGSSTEQGYRTSTRTQHPILISFSSPSTLGVLITPHVAALRASSRFQSTSIEISGQHFITACPSMQNWTPYRSSPLQSTVGRSGTSSAPRIRMYLRS